MQGGFTGEGRRRSISFEGGGTPAKPRSVSPKTSPPDVRGPPSGKTPARPAPMIKRQSSGGFRQSSVKVAVRCRPLSEAEKRKGERAAVDIQGRTVTLAPGPRAHSYAQAGEDDGSSVFAYDYAFGQNSDQLSLFAECGAPLVKELLEGYNATVFAYGQTGSGKTHTMIGSSLEPGLVPRAAWYLFERLEALNARDASRVPAEDADSPRDTDDGFGEDGGGAEDAGGGGRRTFKLTATYLQIYNETLIDMLADSPCDLKIRTSAQLGVFVSGLTEHPVRTPQDVLDLLERGNSKRQTASTKMNAASSRSHAVFTLLLEQEVPVESPHNSPRGAAGATGEDASEGVGEEGADDDGRADDELPPTVRKLRSKINLVDLAGSERAKLSGADEDAALMKECVNINKSLAALGNVIASLSEGKSIHVPYRESKLTQLLEESLGGNAQTVMINAISPRACHHAETLSTLHWAKRAQSIINIASAGEALDATAAMAKMEKMAKLQKQAVAEAQQLARERQLEMQEELDACKAEAEEAWAAAHAAKQVARDQMEQLRAEHERRLENARVEAQEGARHAAGAAVQRKEAELRVKLADAEAASGALASSRRKERNLVVDLAQAAERETRLQKEVRQLQGRLRQEADARARAEEYAEECHDREDGAREAAEAAAARSREAAEERLRAVKAEAAQQVEAAAEEARRAVQADGHEAVESAEAAAAELGDALAAKEDELMMLRVTTARAEQESQEAILAKEAAEEKAQAAEEARQVAERQAAPLLERVAKAEKRADLAEGAAADAQSQLERALEKIDALEQRSASAASELSAVTSERDELRQIDASMRSRAEEMAATVASADARLAVQQEHREMLVEQLREAKAAAEVAQQQARQPDAASTAIVHELRAALSKAQDEARESLAESVRMEGAKSQLEAELRIAEGAREQALASADEARAATATLQSELGALRAQVTQSRESVSKAMGDVQAQVEQRKAAWNAERQELMEKLASAEERAQSLERGSLQHAAARLERIRSESVDAAERTRNEAAHPPAPLHTGPIICSDASSSSSDSLCASPTRRSSMSVESAVTSGSGGSGAPTGGSHHAHHHRHRSRSRERRSSGGLLDKPLGVRLPDFGFGSAEKAERGPRSPPGTVEKTLTNWGKSLANLLPGNGKENGPPTGGGISAPPPVHGPYERFESSTPNKSHAHHRERDRSGASTPTSKASYALPVGGLTPSGGGQMAGGFGRVPSSRSKGAARRGHE